jgi:kumamolisin
VQDPLFQEMAVQGQSFITASGDYCYLKYAGPWPPEDANVTSVGGTSLVTNGPGGAYKSETGWYSPQYGAGSAGGPSPHMVPIPAYQVPFINERNEGSPTLRNVPDIAANADFTYYECWNQPLPPYRQENVQCQGGNGGTSFSSPFVAGFIALANQQAAANGLPPVGFLNPALYALAGGNNYNAVLHDVTTGQCANHYGAVVSYDLMTGLGSPDGQTLINALAGQQ